MRKGECTERKTIKGMTWSQSLIFLFPPYFSKESKSKSQNIPSPTSRVEMQRRNVSGNLNIFMSNSKLMKRTEMQGFLYSSLPPVPVKVVKGVLSKVMCYYTCKPHQFEVMENFYLYPSLSSGCQLQVGTDDMMMGTKEKNIEVLVIRTESTVRLGGSSPR